MNLQEYDILLDTLSKNRKSPIYLGLCLTFGITLGLLMYHYDRDDFSDPINIEDYQEFIQVAENKNESESILKLEQNLK